MNQTILTFDSSAKSFGGPSIPKPQISFEFFPPRTEAAEAKLWSELHKLEKFNPSFVSVTCGAGGSDRNKTQETTLRIGTETRMRPAAHLTCVGTSREEIDAIAKDYWDSGVGHIVALRGDPPAGSDTYEPYPGGYAYASDLVAGLKRVADFEISVAAYPEIHPEAASARDDLDNLKRKIDAGATRALTQFFFDGDVFLRYLDRVRGAGITAPIVAGILPITNFTRTREFAAKCGATIPAWLDALFDGLDDDPATRNLVAAVAAAEQCRQLRAHGISDFHFYTLNKPDLTSAICTILQNPVLPEKGAPHRDLLHAGIA